MGNRAEARAESARVSEEEMRTVSEALQAGSLTDEALDIFQRNAKQNPTDWRSHAMLGQAFMHKEPGSEFAVSSLRKAYIMAPGMAPIAKTLASQLHASVRKQSPAWHVSLFGRARLVEAVEMYRAALALTPIDAEMYVQFGLLSQQSQAAMAKARRADNVVHDDVTATVNIDESPAAGLAIDAWVAATTINPLMTEGYTLLATQLAADGQRARAIQFAQKAIKFAPAQASAYDALGGALLSGIAPANLTTKDRKRTIK